jgi:hypothetical protein
MKTKYSIVLTTYFRRFDQWLKPIVIQIKKERPDIELIVVINGEHNEQFHEDFRKGILDFLKEFPNTYPTIFPKFRSMSHMWNTGIRLASEENVFITQEDLTLRDGFFNIYEDILDQVNQTNIKTFHVNGSYSCISVNKREVIETGWFDERLLGFGYEDGEYTKRYCSSKQIHHFPDINIDECENTLKNEKFSDFIFNESRLSNITLCSQFNRYSKFNEDLHSEIYATPNFKEQYPYELYYLDNNHKL